MADLLEHALAARAAGLNVVPPREDGSKAPEGNWGEWQTRMIDQPDLVRWYRNGRAGIGLVCGAVSGGLELFELEGRAVEAGVLDDLLDLADASGLGELVERVTLGYSERTPSGGIHVLYRCPSPVTTRLAGSPEGVLIETKGEGGYVITAPSAGKVHPTGRPWELLAGGFATITTITGEEQADLHRLARSLDRMPRRAEPRRERQSPRGESWWEVLPGDDFNAKATWGETLEPHGWRRLFTTRDGNEHWVRPGKADGTSATVSDNGEGVLYVFTNSTPFEPRTGYSRFGAYAVLEHGGDYKAAAKALEEQGYGKRLAREAGSLEHGDGDHHEHGDEDHHEHGDGDHHEHGDGDHHLHRRPDLGEYPMPTGEEAFFVDWPAFWSRDRLGADWFDDVLARGRGHAIYASHKTGKSLLMLWLAVRMARRGVAVVYLDFEMGDDDLFEWLADMGYGPETDLSFLHYAVLPSLPPLDTEQGASTLLAKVDAVIAAHPGAEVAVVIDTTARAVAGEKNSADTYRDFYRFTGTGLKRRGITWARLDHAGKDTAKGQRGSSAKGDDVDVVWRLVRTDNGLELRREASRMGWVPERVAFRQVTEPLRFVRVAEDWPAGTAEVAAILEKLNVPVVAGERPAGHALRDAGHQAGQYLVRAAQKYRRQLADEASR